MTYHYMSRSLRRIANCQRRLNRRVSFNVCASCHLIARRDRQAPRLVTLVNWSRIPVNILSWCLLDSFYGTWTHIGNPIALPSLQWSSKAPRVASFQAAWVNPIGNMYHASLWWMWGPVPLVACSVASISYSSCNAGKRIPIRNPCFTEHLSDCLAWCKTCRTQSHIWCIRSIDLDAFSCKCCMSAFLLFLGLRQRLGSRIGSSYPIIWPVTAPIAVSQSQNCFTKYFIRPLSLNAHLRSRFQSIFSIAVGSSCCATLFIFRFLKNL